MAECLLPGTHVLSNLFSHFTRHLRAEESSALAAGSLASYSLPWYFLFRVHEPVPRFETWVETIPGKHPRMREMVDLARSAGKSREVE